MKARPTHDYAAKGKCGCVLAIHYDEADKATGKWVASQIALGMTVERMPIGEASRLLMIPCTHVKDEPKQQGLGI